MGLSTAQLLALKNDIQADSSFNSLPHNSDGADVIARAYNLQASPNWTVWKTNVSIKEVGDNIVGTELAGLTSSNISRLQAVIALSVEGVNPTLPDRRGFFDDIFSGAGGAQTRPKLLTLWKRLATRAEKLFSTGTGSDATPASLTFEGNLGYNDVMLAMGW